MHHCSWSRRTAGPRPASLERYATSATVTVAPASAGPSGCSSVRLDRRSHGRRDGRQGPAQLELGSVPERVPRLLIGGLPTPEGHPSGAAVLGDADEPLELVP